MRDPRSDLFISADIETDGPIPGKYSMLSFGLCVAGHFDGRHYARRDQEHDALFYRELKPVTENFEADALAVNGLDREVLAQKGDDPTQAMRDADRWVRSHAGDARPVLVAYPVAFDWAFIYWYFIQYAGASPFGFSSCLDIRTLYQARALTPFDSSSQHSMPHWLLPKREHTHNAADDAFEQAELFSNIFEWALKGGGPKEPTWPTDRVAPNWMEPAEIPPPLPPPGVLGTRERRRQYMR